jgi:hypothetical protein
VSDDTTFISEPPARPAPAVDEDGTLVAELTKKGFVASKRFPGVDVTVPSHLPVDAIKELNGHPRIRTVTFKRTRFEDGFHPVTDEDVRALNGLDGLTALEFEVCPKITAAAFRDLGRFPKLTSVSTKDTPVDAAATEELAKLKTLERVSFAGAKLTDKALAALSRVRTLKSIWLHKADVTALGIKMLNALPDLERLALQDIDAVDAALGDLNLPKLRYLNLGLSDITDEGLGKLPVLPALVEIFLSGPTVTDTGLKHLQKQPSLETIRLLGTKVTRTGAEELKKLKPQLAIYGIEK